jgi:hypothetical protein
MTSAPTEVPATATPEVPTDTPEPPTAVASPTPEVSRLTANATVNVRSGPGTNYAQIGRLQAGQSFDITGKNPTGDWWQFDFNGRSGWVLKELVRASGGERVQVAANIAPPPTARPVPTRAPQRPAATRPPAAVPAPAAAATKYRLTGNVISLPNSNPIITVWCRLNDKSKNPLGGTIRVTGSGVPDKNFPALPAFADPFGKLPISAECKIEFPYAPGDYSAVLVEGGQPVSEPFNFTATNEVREFVVEWQVR